MTASLPASPTALPEINGAGREKVAADALKRKIENV
jgi:hypothetical protein